MELQKFVLDILLGHCLSAHTDLTNIGHQTLLRADVENCLNTGLPSLENMGCGRLQCKCAQLLTFLQREKGIILTQEHEKTVHYVSEDKCSVISGSTQRILKSCTSAANKKGFV